MNMGKDWKNRRRHMVTGETLGMEQSIPVAISRETRVSEIQHFIWVSVKQLRSCTKLSPPSSPRCAPAAGMCTWTLSNGQDTPPGPAQRTPAQDPGENRGVPVDKSLNSCEAPPQPREPVGSQEQWGNFLFGPTAQGSFNATLLRSLDFCTCPHVLPPLPRWRFWTKKFTLGVLCCDWWLEIRACCEVFSNSGLFLGRKINSFRDSGKREGHLKSGQESRRYLGPPVGRLGDKTETENYFI